MQKILYFLGGRAREGRSMIYTCRRDCTCRTCREGSYKGGGSLVGADDGLLPCGGVTRCHDDENFIMAVWAKWLGRSIFVGKTNLGGRFWQHSGTQDPCQHATTSLKLGESDMNVG
jgi:hypothetical protein